MNNGSLRVVVTLGVVAAVVLTVLLAAPLVDAQGVTSKLLAQYLAQTGVNWKVDDKDPDVLRVTKTAGLKKAEFVEIVITNIPSKSLVTLRAFPKADGKFLGLARAGNQQGLMKYMLQVNGTAFGAYFIEEGGDIGFRYVFTTESGLGYEAFRVALSELLRIADEVMVPTYNKYR